MWGYIISVHLDIDRNVMPVHRRKDITVTCTDITLCKCDFIRNENGVFLLLHNINTSHYCKPRIKFIGPLYIEKNSVSLRGDMMHIYNMVIYIDGPVRISSNKVYYNFNMILFRSCHCLRKWANSDIS